MEEQPNDFELLIHGLTGQWPVGACVVFSWVCCQICVTEDVLITKEIDRKEIGLKEGHSCPVTFMTRLRCQSAVGHWLENALAFLGLEMSQAKPGVKMHESKGLWPVPEMEVFCCLVMSLDAETHMMAKQDMTTQMGTQDMDAFSATSK